MTTETLQHIARQIAGGIGSHNYVNGCWHLHVPAARAALVALREPTPQMLEIIKQSQHPDWVPHYVAVWGEVFDAALGELPEPSPELVLQRLADVEAVLTRLQGMGVERINGAMRVRRIT